MALAHTVVGDGQKTVVLLHGFLGSGRNLRTVALRLVEADPSVRALLVDLPGHGESPPATEDETLQSMASKVCELINGPAHFIGHSLGGRVSLAAVDVAAAKVATVSMLDITPSPIQTETSESGSVLNVLREAPASAPTRQALRDFLTGRGISVGIAEWLLTNVVTEGGAVRWRFDRESLHRLHTRVNRQDLWPIIERRERPVMVVRASRSKYVTSDDVSRLSTYGVPVKEIDAGHFVHVEALEPLMRELIHWTA